LIKTLGDVTQKTIAEYVGVGQSKINDILQFECNPQGYANKEPKAETVVKIAKAFNVSTDYLLGFTDYKTTDRAAKELCNTLGLSEEAIDILSANPNSALAKEFRGTWANEMVERTKKNNESSIDELVEKETMFIAETVSDNVAPVINWLINDYVEDFIRSLYDDDDFINHSFIALFKEYIEGIDAEKCEIIDISDDNINSKTQQFPIANSHIFAICKDGSYMHSHQNIKSLLIDSRIGEINARLYNLKYKKMSKERG
jgi:transcriptional regulator with XRE-family HTH domain